MIGNIIMEIEPDDIYLGQDLIDPVCLAHGLPWSANPPHWAGRCLICQLCFKVLDSTADCNSLPDGSYEDVCLQCAKEEQELTARRRRRRFRRPRLMVQ